MDKKKTSEKGPVPPDQTGARPLAKSPAAVADSPKKVTKALEPTTPPVKGEADDSKAPLRALIRYLESVLETSDRPLMLWSKRGQAKMVAELRKRGFTVNPEEVPQMLRDVGFTQLKPGDPGTVSKEQKELLAKEQLAYFSGLAQEALARRQPVLVIETKRVRKPQRPQVESGVSEMGAFPTGGRAMTLDLSFEAMERGIYEVAREGDLVVVGSDLDEASLALSSISGWWREEGRKIHRGSEYLLLAVRGRFIYGYGADLWVTRLQDLANSVNKPLRVCHLPGPGRLPGQELELFSFFSTNWLGQREGVSRTTVKSLNPNSPAKGLKIKCWVDHRDHSVSREASAMELDFVTYEPMPFNGEINYIILNQ
jgi:hypothetical protein